MAEGLQPGPDEVSALRAALAAAELRADAAEARASVVEAKASCDAALIAHLKLEIAKLKRAHFGQTSERSQRPARPVRAAAGGAGSVRHPRRAEG